MGILRDSSGQPDEPGPVLAPPAAGGPTVAPPLPGAAAPAGGAAAEGEQPSELRRRRDALAEQVTELHWDLGGLAYEMAIRDHFRLDVLVRRAAILQERDAELAEVERLLRMQEDGVAGSCPACSAPHSRGALYCWQCGATLMERVPSSVIHDGEHATGAMDALLAGAPDARPDAAPGVDGERQQP